MAAQLSVDPENNAGAIVLSGKDLDELSDDPDQLQSDLGSLGRAIGWAQWRADVYRWIHGRPVAAEVLDSRDSHQSKSFLGGIRQARIRQDRDFHKARNGSVARAVLGDRQRFGFQFAQPISGNGSLAGLRYDSIQRKFWRTAEQEGVVLRSTDNTGTSRTSLW